MAKRLFDLFLSLLGLIVLSPLFVIIAMLIKLDSNGPVFYRGSRVGRNGCPFRMFKFRTMFVDAADIRNPDGSTFNSENDPRVTHIGHILRKFSLDELPQLFNVLRGEMSLVGPRPELPDQLQSYTPIERRRLLVKPGITGLAQINGRNSISWEKRKQIDLMYVEHHSLRLDLFILMRTIPQVLFHRDVFTNRKPEYPNRD